ncbi:MAG: PorT family protein [Prevotella sp.]|nr:PorT family protein [Prevotella sp.]
MSLCHSVKMRSVFLFLIFATTLPVSAQIGDHRNDLQIGGGAGYVLSNIGFTPKVTQSMHGGLTAGIAAKYVCEKYFNTICSVYGELNLTQAGWKEDIITADDKPVVNPQTGLAETYSRTLTYLQLPVFAHLAWGKEQKGMQFFFQAGPQFGFLLGESSKANFDIETPNLDERSNKTVAQYGMKVENTFDYGIAAGLGLEYTLPRAGHFLIEGRYYYGLGNIYGDSKRDYFSKSNNNNIVVRLTYLFDIIKTKKQ